MRLTEISIKEIAPRGKYGALLDEFEASGMVAARVDEIDSGERVTYEGLRHAARKRDGIDIIKRGGLIFIVRLA